MSCDTTKQSVCGWQYIYWLTLLGWMISLLEFFCTWMDGRLVGFNGISISIGYLMPNLHVEIGNVIIGQILPEVLTHTHNPSLNLAIFILLWYIYISIYINQKDMTTNRHGYAWCKKWTRRREFNSCLHFTSTIFSPVISK